MNIILGANGQIGSAVVNGLYEKNKPVRAIVRSDKKKFNLKIETEIADLANANDLIKAFKGGDTVFIITPENFNSNDIFEDTKNYLKNIKIAIQKNNIKKIVGLSCGGAHIDNNTGFILLSRMLENSFDNDDIKKVFIRPSYYYSNWLNYLDTMNNYGILPSFIPMNLKIDMVSPIDVSKICVEKIIDSNLPDKTICELIGLEKYSPNDVAAVFSKLLNKNITVGPIEKKDWKKTLMENGFTENTAQNMFDMTNALVENLAPIENREDAIKTLMTFEEYLKIKL
jgi:uncharacterized protein YbjT (DUF2867 family)